MTKRSSAHGHAISPALPATDDQEAADGPAGGEDRGGDEPRQAQGESAEASGTPDDDDVQAHRGLRSPILPSAAERAEHEISHLQYRSWCDGCVEGFGRERPHRAMGQLAARRVPVISLDYLFITEAGVFRSDELNDEEKEQALKIIAVYC